MHIRKGIDPNSEQEQAKRRAREARRAYLEHCKRAEAARIKLITAHSYLMSVMANYRGMGNKSEEIDTIDLIMSELDRQMNALKNEAVIGRIE